MGVSSAYPPIASASLVGLASMASNANVRNETGAYSEYVNAAQVKLSPAALKAYGKVTSGSLSDQVGVSAITNIGSNKWRIDFSVTFTGNPLVVCAPYSDAAGNLIQFQVTAVTSTSATVQGRYVNNGGVVGTTGTEDFSFAAFGKIN